jgi:putative endonuclease
LIVSLTRKYNQALSIHPYPKAAGKYPESGSANYLPFYTLLKRKKQVASHNTLGKQGEELAVKWLGDNGYEILHRNWHHSHYEIDIIAFKNNKLHFVEVKARNDSRFGHPEDSVTKKKFRNLKKAADEFLFLNPGHQWIQYDILAITLFSYKEAEYFLLEDVFL